MYSVGHAEGVQGQYRFVKETSYERENHGSGSLQTKTLTAELQVEVVKKKKTKRTDVPVNEVVAGGLPHAELQKAVEKEYEMALQDRVMEETKEKKNAVEAYVYDMRNKVLFSF